MHTGENIQALRKILDMTRLMSIVVLIIHFYYYCYGAFVEWELHHALCDRILDNIFDTGLFSSFHKSKLIGLMFLLISMIGAKGRKKEKQRYSTPVFCITTGLLIYFFSYLILLVKTKITHMAGVYICLTSVGYMLILSGGVSLRNTE